MGLLTLRQFLELTPDKPHFRHHIRLQLIVLFPRKIPWKKIHGDMKKIGGDAYNKSYEDWNNAIKPNYRRENKYPEGSSRFHMFILYGMYIRGSETNAELKLKECADFALRQVFHKSPEEKYKEHLALKTEFKHLARNSVPSSKGKGEASEFEAMFRTWNMTNADALAECADRFIRDHIEMPPFEIASGIAEEADALGLFADDIEKENFEYCAAGSHFRGAVADQLVSSTSAATRSQRSWQLDANWIEFILPHFENPEVVKRERDRIRIENKEDLARLNLLDTLELVINARPYNDVMESPIGLLNAYEIGNGTGITRDFITLVRAKYCIMTGKSHRAIVDFQTVCESPFVPKDLLWDARYNRINASYSLRKVELYGSKSVSTDLDCRGLDNFDAVKLIGEFCEGKVDPVNFTPADIEEATRIWGVSAAKIIYFYHLEDMLADGHRPGVLRDSFECITRMLKILSNTRRPVETHGYYVKDCWYPLIFLYAVCHRFGEYKIMREIEDTLRDFDEWGPQARALKRDVEEETKSGNLMMMIHLLNQARHRTLSSGDYDGSDDYRTLRRNFGRIVQHPALGQSVNHDARQIGLDVGRYDDLAAMRAIASSHKNYVIGFQPTQ